MSTQGQSLGRQLRVMAVELLRIFESAVATVRISALPRNDVTIRLTLAPLMARCQRCAFSGPSLIAWSGTCLTHRKQRRSICTAMTNHLCIRNTYDSLEPEGIQLAGSILVN